MQLNQQVIDTFNKAFTILSNAIDKQRENEYIAINLLISVFSGLGGEK